jgi:plasmid stabilization system protein ParE
VPDSAVPGRSVRVHPDAIRDVEDGIAFYVNRSPIAAERFLTEVEQALDSVAEAPERWPPFRAGTRRFVMADFPYSIIYREVGNEIQVLAVAHAKRRPQYWRGRRL